MPSEKQIRETVIQKLGRDGWIVWWPRKVRYIKEQDIFGVWDCIAMKKDKVRLIQYTTKNNANARVNKIRAWMGRYDITFPGEVWGYDTKKGEFDIAILTDKNVV